MSGASERRLPLLTARLRLRPLRADDLEDLHRLYRDPQVELFAGRHTREEVQQELRFDIDHQARHGWAMWAIEELSTGRFLGACGLRPLEMRGPEIELGYDLIPSAWGRGIATEAATATVQFALGPLAIDRLIAVVKPTHCASRRVLENAGLKCAGERDAYGERLMLYEIERAGRAGR